MKLPHQWNENELKAIEEQILAEQARGANIRYWEDVVVGENLQPITKGPLGMTDEIAYLIGGGALRVTIPSSGSVCPSKPTVASTAPRTEHTARCTSVSTVCCVARSPRGVAGCPHAAATLHSAAPTRARRLAHRHSPCRLNAAPLD